MTDPQRAALRVYDELLARTGEAHPRPRIAPVRRLAELVGSPQLSFPVVQVAGTNGKTSTSRAIESLFRAHGLRTGLFTSPHLESFTERFQLDGEPVNGTVLAEAWDELRLPLQILDAELAAEGQGPITFFEALVVLAFAIFADAPVDVAVIEVGIGGEWDATNIANAQVAVFTPIDVDHAGILGSRLQDIARTKAGIIKPGSVVVSASQARDALREIAEVSEQQDARLYVAGRDFAILDDLMAVGGRQLTAKGLHGHEYEPAFVPVYGSYQAENAALAIAAVEAFFGGERPLPQEVLTQGLGQLTVPGRLQLIDSDPIVYVDAAHNPHGAEALARAVTETFAFQELAVVAGVLAEKDASGVLAALEPIADRFLLTPVASPRTLAPEELGVLAASLSDDTPTAITQSLHDALEQARSWALQGEGRAVLVVGSVVLAGEALTYAREEGWKTR